MDTVLNELINKRIETANLDYKAGFEWAKKNRDHQFELIRDILAMANTRDGGTIILGVKDDTRELAGVSKEVWNSFDQSAIAEMVHRYSKPKVGLQVIKTQVESKLVVALTIAEFEDVPIICTETITALNTTWPILRKSAVYVRTSAANHRRDIIRPRHEGIAQPCHAEARGRTPAKCGTSDQRETARPRRRKH